MKRNKPINQRSKTNKQRHVSNDPVPPDTPCEFGFHVCTGTACDNHELSGGSKSRNQSISIGFQVMTCRACHDFWELGLTKEEKRAIRSEKQLEVMAKHGLSVKEFKDIVGENYTDIEFYA